jgi:hypothetical protein
MRTLYAPHQGVHETAALRASCGIAGAFEGMVGVRRYRKDDFNVLLAYNVIISTLNKRTTLNKRLYHQHCHLS